MALFTTLRPGIETDLSSDPHDVPGVWAGDDEAAAFRGMSPAIPEVAFGAGSLTGTAERLVVCSGVGPPEAMAFTPDNLNRLR